MTSEVACARTSQFELPLRGRGVHATPTVVILKLVSVSVVRLRELESICLMHSPPSIHVPCRFFRTRIGLFRKWRTNSVHSKKVHNGAAGGRRFFRLYGGRVRKRTGGARARALGRHNLSPLPTYRPRPPDGKSMHGLATLKPPIGIESCGSALRPPLGQTLIGASAPRNLMRGHHSAQAYRM